MESKNIFFTMQPILLSMGLGYQLASYRFENLDGVVFASTLSDKNDVYTVEHYVDRAALIEGHEKWKDRLSNISQVWCYKRKKMYTLVPDPEIKNI